VLLWSAASILRASLIKICLIASLVLAAPILAKDALANDDDRAFKDAVQAVKARDYGRAITLFEPQAKAAKHDAQYNMAVLLQAGKGRPRNYPDALYWSWLAQLGGIEGAEDIASDMLDALTSDDVKTVRTLVGDALKARLDNGDINAIPQFADYHLTILEEPDYDTAYIWYSIAVALNIPDMVDLRDDTESNVEAKNLAGLQAKASELFATYKFEPFIPTGKGGTNGS
jgi:hypothetical protein